MKLYINKIQPVIIFLFVLGIGFNSTAQSTPCSKENSSEKNYAMLVRNTQHMEAALKTVSQMRASGKKYNAFEVVICGKVVKELADQENEKIFYMLKQAKDLNVTFSVCGMSLDKFSITTDQLPAQFNVVDNGLIRIFELQEKCYYTIEL